MKIALIQLNYIVGDIDGNAEKIISAVKNVNADLCITSELALLGYPPRDLLLYDSFIDLIQKKLQYIAQQLQYSTPLLLGTVVPNKSGCGKPLYNAAVFIEKGEIRQEFYKTLLPTYDVFDEDRYFESNTNLNILEFRNKKFGITICEDIWNNQEFWHELRYQTNPLTQLAENNIDCFINLSASPYFLKKQDQIRQPLIQSWATKYKLPFLTVNQVGGNDDLIFDGNSSYVNENGQLIAKAKAFEEDILLLDLEDKASVNLIGDIKEEEEMFAGLVTGTRDYLNKCGFKKAVLGLSGGIDSALTLVIAVEALGKDNVVPVLMPSPYSSEGSVQDSLQLALNLEIDTHTIEINSIMQSYDEALSSVFKNTEKDITEENLQARIRGNLLMAISNKYNALLLTTGNKSELSVGYCTIYGDMCGGLAVISDVYKTWVYRISRWINFSRGKMIIPEAIINKAPSAELRPNQTDQDSLPPYDILDDILYRYIELQQSPEIIAAAGIDESLVIKVLSLFNKAEFKRRQAAPGLKVTPRAYGSGWRMPIAARYTFQLKQRDNNIWSCG